ncbi:MAG TPA: hypothetical protein VFD83_00875 [Candidatus Polarisedimenticolia bacterium]|nr:hypothetical protein [Candidatus Polarisedimenticolia bacterium]
MLRLARIAVMISVLISTSGVSTASQAKEPFARVYLALRGCTSCSHCRTAIRQMARSGSSGGEARVTTDAVEVRYPRPVASIPLRDVIHRLAENRLHDLTLVDVLFEAEGTVARSSDGATFTLKGSDQSFPLRLEATHADGPVRLTALVQGWREKGKLTLVARGVAPARAT